MREKIEKVIFNIINKHNPSFALTSLSLGKQGWKLMNNLDSFVIKVFKAKYFPHCDFLDAPKGSNLSYVCIVCLSLN